MDPLCDFCCAQRALIYCDSDAARLCLPCDAFIHSANALARRHVRAPLCDRCFSQPAAARCPATNASVCRSCDGNTTAGMLPVHGYSGCPSLPELSLLWSNYSPLEGSSAADQGSWDPLVNVNGILPPQGAAGLIGTRGTSNELCPPLMQDQPIVTSKMGFSFNDLAMSGDSEYYEGFNNWSSSSFNIDNTDLFACPPKWQDARILEGLFMEKNFSVGDSNVHVENTAEVMNGNTDQTILNNSANGNIMISFPGRHMHPNISVSLSNLTGESSAADFQDCGISPMLLTGESQCDSNMETNHPQARNEAKLRYNEKKKSRLFGKNIKYASRKARADTRKRARGRFVKAGEEYDYDPLTVAS